MTCLALVRHAPTDWNFSKRMQGHVDMPLTAASRALVSRWRLPPEFQDFEWFVSPLRRARETAQILLGREAAVEPTLIEMSWGEWEGRKLLVLRDELGPAMVEVEAMGLDFRPPNGESPRDVQARLLPWLRHLAHAGRPTGAVTHKGVIRAILSLATGWDFVGKPPVDFDWSSAHLFMLDHDGHPRIERLNISLIER